MLINRWVLAVVLVLSCTSVHAFDTIRFGNRLIETGDSESKVIRVAGKPDLREPIENEFGAIRGYRLEYDLRDKTVVIVIRQGRVAKISEIRD